MLAGIKNFSQHFVSILHFSSFSGIPIHQISSEILAVEKWKFKMSFNYK